MNLLLLRRQIPVALREVRTTFIPKTTDATEPSQIRPITVASVLQRRVHRIMAKRVVAAVSQNVRQRAFQPVDGCAENVWLLSAAISEAKRSLRPLHMASIDLTKAFDRVAAQAILRGARRAGFSSDFVRYLKDLYTNSRIVLQFQGEALGVQPMTGIRQRDPPRLSCSTSCWTSTSRTSTLTSGSSLETYASASTVGVITETRRGKSKTTKVQCQGANIRQAWQVCTAFSRK